MKRALVIGASSGLGRAIATELSKQSVKFVALVGRNQSALQSLAETLNKHGMETSIAAVDITKEEDITSLAARANKEWYIDTVFWCAGGGYFKTFTNSSQDEVMQTIRLNIIAPTLFFHSLLKTLTDVQKNLHIVVISSHANYLRVPHFAVYSSAKTYLTNLAATIRTEIKNLGMDSRVQISIASPGAMDTQFSDRAGIPLMLSKRMSPEVAAQKILRALPSSNIIYLTPLDHVMSLSNRLIPWRFFDAFFNRVQSHYLKPK